MPPKRNTQVLARKLEEAQAMTDAEAQFDQIKVQRRDDVLNAETKGQIRGLGGMDAGPVESSPDADQYVTLYHAYDSRAVEVPLYMVTKRLALRFPDNNDVDPKYKNKQVWHLQPQPNTLADRPFKCRLSVDCTPEQREEMVAAGIAPMCRKPGGFWTQFDADEHFRVKHKTRWAAYQRHLTERRENRQADSMKDVIDALVNRLPATS